MVYSSSLRGLQRLLTLKCTDAGNIAADFADPRDVLKLAGGTLEAQVELLLLQVQQLIAQLIGRQGGEIRLSL
ncbi:hypothetical protein ASF27_16045 [Methylobacterium sp. Leaf102]|nr:hypothetical protein ASF27_16045 [Methylobacterium sp. Leaf102]